MKYKEVKRHYESGQIDCHYFADENDDECGECRGYHRNGQSWWHFFKRGGLLYGEVKWFSRDGVVLHHYLMGGEYNDLAIVIDDGRESTHTEEELIEIAKERGVPLLSELPKTEEEVTLWNLKYPGMPCLPISTE